MFDGTDWLGQACLDGHGEDDPQILPSSVFTLFISIYGPAID